MRPPEDEDHVSYTFYVPSGLWSEWKNTLPRETTLHDRLQTLIELDADRRGDLPDINDDERSNLLRLKLGRCHARASTACRALENDNPDKALVTMDKIEEIAEPFARES